MNCQLHFCKCLKYQANLIGHPSLLTRLITRNTFDARPLFKKDASRLINSYSLHILWWRNTKKLGPQISRDPAKGGWNGWRQDSGKQLSNSLLIKCLSQAWQDGAAVSELQRTGTKGSFRVWSQQDRGSLNESQRRDGLGPAVSWR